MQIELQAPVVRLGIKGLLDGDSLEALCYVLEQDILSSA